MFKRKISFHIWDGFSMVLTLCLVVGIMLSLLPLGAAQATPVFEAAPSHPQAAWQQVNPPPGTYENQEPDYPPHLFDSYLDRDIPSSPTHPYRELDLFQPEKMVVVSPDGTLPVPSSLGGGSLPAGIDPRFIYPGITVDLTYDVVMGDIWDDRGETVIVNMGADGYGAAVVDDAGFFWTPIWHSTDGYVMDIDCGMTISVVVGTDPAINITPPMPDRRD